MSNPFPRRAAGPIVLGLAAALVAAAPARAAEGGKAAGSLQLVPADAAFYSVSLRNREQLEMIARSNAVARIKAMPAVQFGLKQLHDQLQAPGSPVGPALALLHQPENQQLLELLGDMVSDEFFVYGGANWTGFTELLVQVGGAVRYGPAMMQITGQARGQDQGKMQGQMLLRVLAEHPQLIRVPDTVIGFRLTQTDAAKAQLRRLEGLLKQATAGGPLQGRYKKATVGGDEFLTLTLDGSLVPWDQVPFKDIEEKPGEFDEVVKQLRQLKLTISLGIRGKYLLLGIGSSTDAVAKFGKGPALAGRPELKPLAAFADRRLTGVSYGSKAIAAAAASKGDVMEMMGALKTGLGQLGLTDAQRKKLEADLDALAKQVAGHVTEPGASMGFSFLTDRGQESYAYDYSPRPAGAAAKPLTILDHLGGDPVLAFASRGPDPTPGYRELSRWAKIFYGHFEEIGLAKLGADEREKFQEVAKVALPLLKRFDEITGTLFLPALADGQSAFVLDAKLASKQWFALLPGTDKPLALPEPAYVHGTSDPAKLRQAGEEYRKLVNDTLAKAREMGAQMPDISVPQPKSQKLKAGTMYFWPIPSVGQDEQILPNIGLSDEFLVFSISQAHTERLLERRPLKADGGPLAGKETFLSVAVFNFPALIDAASPWLDQVVLPNALANLPPEQANDKTFGKEAITEQVKTVLEVLKCFRGAASVTYLKDGALVTHTESVFRDLGK